MPYIVKWRASINDFRTSFYSYPNVFHSLNEALVFIASQYIRDRDVHYDYKVFLDGAEEETGIIFTWEKLHIMVERYRV